MDISTSPEDLYIIESVLDFIRANLYNIERTWGTDSSQYRTTREIMQQYWDANAQKIKGKNIDIKLGSSLEDLLAGMSLEGKTDVSAEAKPASASDATQS